MTFFIELFQRSSPLFVINVTGGLKCSPLKKILTDGAFILYAKSVGLLTHHS